jgi:hypothetical protein
MLRGSLGSRSTGRWSSGATVIGFAGAAHCFDGHADMLRGLGVKHIAHNFDEARELVGLD